MAGSRDHCSGCKFGEVAPTNDDRVSKIEGVLVADHFFAEGDLSRQRKTRQFEQAGRSLGIEEERIEAARQCAKAMLDGTCEAPWSLREE